MGPSIFCVLYTVCSTRRLQSIASSKAKAPPGEAGLSGTIPGQIGGNVGVRSQGALVSFRRTILPQIRPASITFLPHPLKMCKHQVPISQFSDVIILVRPAKSPPFDYLTRLAALWFSLPCRGCCCATDPVVQQPRPPVGMEQSNAQAL
jgi:hypothetical protein